MSFGPESRRVSYFSSIGPGTSGPKMCPKMRFRHNKMFLVGGQRTRQRGSPQGHPKMGKLNLFWLIITARFGHKMIILGIPVAPGASSTLFAIANKVEEAAGAIGRPKIANFGAKTGGKNEPKNV